MTKLVYNAIRTPDGTVLESMHRHNYKSHIDANGLTYMVDGGLEYAKRSVQPIPYEELSVYLGGNHELIRQVVTWGTYGIDGNEALKYVKISDMSDSHIQACLDNVPRMHPHYREAFENELTFREEKNNV